MYKIRINTNEFVDKRRKTIEMQIHNDICKKLNGLEWEYKTVRGVIDRIKEITGGVTNNIMIYSDSNLMLIKNEPYGKLEVKKSLPGVCNNYVDLERVVRHLEKDKYVRLPFSVFYQDNSMVNTLGLNKCYIEIIKG